MQAVTHRVLPKGDTAFAERAHREFGMGRHANLANDDDVERRAQGSCDLVGNDNSPTRKTEHDRGAVVPARAKVRAKQPSGVGSVNEALHVLGLAVIDVARRRHR